MPRSIFKDSVLYGSKRTATFWLAIFAGLALATTGLLRLADWYTSTHRLRIPAPSITITHSNAKPNEAKIDTSKDTYTVPANQPRLLEAPSIGVKGFIQQVGIDQFNTIATPSNIHMAGWYNGSVKPGEAGVSVIDGHVHGRYEPAIFYTLRKLQPGAVVKVTYGDGRQVEFAVIKVAQYDAGTAIEHIFEKLPKVDKELVLVTCGGTFNKSTAAYNQRLLVYAQVV